MKLSEKASFAAQEEWAAAFCLCGITGLRKHVRDLVRELPGVRDNEEPEYVHRTRVALRRLRSLLPLFADCLPRKRSATWNKALRRTARVLGAARDTDVQMAFVQTCLDTLEDEQARPGVARLLLRLQQQRQHLQKPVLAALKRLEERRLLAKMQRFLRALGQHIRAHYQTTPTPAVYDHIGHIVEEQLTAVQAQAALVTTPQQSSELHALRIAVKRLRYTMQAFAPLYPGVFREPLQLARTLQDVLGAIHDSDVWLHDLPQFQAEEQQRTMEYFGTLEPFAMLTPGFAALEAYCQQRRCKAWETFVALWHQEQTQQLWQTLRQTLQACQPAESAVAVQDDEEVPTATPASVPVLEASAQVSPAPLPQAVCLHEATLRACRDAWRWHATTLIAAIPPGSLMTYSDFAAWVNHTHGLRINAGNVAWLRRYLFTLLGDSTTLPLHRLARAGDVHSLQETEDMKTFNDRLRAAEDILTQPVWWRPS